MVNLAKIYKILIINKSCNEKKQKKKDTCKNLENNKQRLILEDNMHILK